MRHETAEQIRALIDHRIPESAGLEYKSQLDIGSRSEKGEVLKDLTGMANGGGGTILYGIDEVRREETNVASEITPVRDHGVAGAVEDLVRDGVQPPLLVEYGRIEVEDGFVLAVDVRPSSLGPYMVTAYGKHTYFHRSGTSTSPMNERQVRDAYALALRARETRAQDWADRGLPLRPTAGAWVVVSGLPEVIAGDVIDMLVMEPHDLVPPDDLLTYTNISEIGDLAPAIEELGRWAGGFHGESSCDGAVDRVVRVDRDGALALGFMFSRVAHEQVWTPRVFRLVNTALLYAGWVWGQQDIRSAVELRIELLHGSNRIFTGVDETSESPDARTINDPVGIGGDSVAITETVLPDALGRASTRHGVVMRFADRLHQALGEMRAEAPFRRGALYDRAGRCLNLSVASECIWDDTARSGHQATIHTNGAVTSHGGEVVGWYLEGVVTDEDGNAVAVLEMAPGRGCPDDFVGQLLSIEVDGAAARYGDRPTKCPVEAVAPDPTGRWSAVDLRTLLG